MKRYIKYVLLLALIGMGIGFYLYNKPHQNMQRAKADMTLPASELFSAFEANEDAANAQYLDKVVQVEGVIQDINQDENGQFSLTLESGSDMFGVICQFDEQSEHQTDHLKTGQKVTLKGICTGMLMDVVLVRCVQI